MNAESRGISGNRIALHAFSILTTVTTFVLLASGGLVTSHGVGMAVPDWPTTFGYNMFALPWDRWTGGVFFEHSHRVLASGVGLLTVILAVWTWLADPRRWVRVLVISAVIGVVLQGILGGWRVLAVWNEIGIFHGMLAQAFFVLLGIISVATSPSWLRGHWARAEPVGLLRWAALALTVIIFVQLGVAATMRHAHAGLSINDFPLAYGQVIPDTSPGAIRSINEARYAANEMPTTAALIWLQMVHRGLAAVIAAGVALLAWMAFRQGGNVARRWSLVLSGMIVAQIVLGAYTIWTNKAADVATAHMALGALTLFVSGLLTFRLFAMQRGVPIENNSPAARSARVEVAA